MRTFEDIKKEVKLSSEYRLEKIANEIPVKTDYFAAVELELQNILNDPDLLISKTEELILTRIQGVIDMANARKNIDDIMKFSLLGITVEDKNIVEKIETCREYPNNPAFMEDLRNSICEHYNIHNQIDVLDSRSM